MKRVFQSTAVTVALLASSHIAHAREEASTQKVALNIDAPTLAQALLQFTDQTNLQLVFPADSAGSASAPKVVGTYTPQAALDTLLKDTGFKYEFVNDRIVSVSRMSDSDRIRLAQEDSGTAPPPAGASAEAAPIQLDEVVVTGSWIRGTPNIGSHVLTLDRSYIDRTGALTVQDILRTLPQDFTGAVSEDNSSDSNALNSNRGMAVNLRGLGADSTLVLVNGRRQAAGGLSGSFVDISSLSPSAIERIEVLTDGASAIYGSDAVAGVVNFILRKDYEGAETRVQAGTLSGDATEYHASQLFGKSWSSGNVMASYQYYKREALGAADRPYTASDDLRPFGGSDFRRANGNPGTILTTTNVPAFAIPSGQDGTSLTAASFTPGTRNYQTSNQEADLLPLQELHTAFLSVTQELGERVSLSAEGRFGTRNMRFQGFGFPSTLIIPNTNAFYVNPFGTTAPVRVAYDFADDLGPLTQNSTTDTYDGALRGLFKISADWRVSLTGSYGKEKTSWVQDNQVNSAALAPFLASSDRTIAFNAFGDGSHTNPATLDAIRGQQRLSADTNVRGGNLTADGRLFLLPAGVVKLAIGVDHRNELLETHSSVTGGLPTRADTGRHVTSEFAELAVPIVGEDQGVPGVRRLQLSLAGRYDDYSDFGNSLNPRFGLGWQVIEALTVRGTWGKSYKAPRLIDLLDGPTASIQNQAAILTVADPKSPTGTSRLLRITGGNPDLQPETARSWTAGVDLALEDAGLKLSFTYFDIDYKDRIAAGGPSSVVLTQEAIWAEVITRNPTPAQYGPICSSPLFRSGDCTIAPDAIADLRLRNLSRVHTNGLDVSGAQLFQTGLGDFQLGVNGTYTFRFDRAVSSTAPEQNLIDTYANPLKLRVRGSAAWLWRGFSVNSFIDFNGGYSDTNSVTPRHVSSLTTMDLQLAYQTASGTKWTDDVRVGLNVANVFDRKPPFFNVVGLGYDGANADLYGRVMSVLISKAW